MKKLLVGVLAAGLLSIFAPSTLHAQEWTDATIVKVPFSFIAGQKVLPAGRYRITADDSDLSLLFIEGVDHPAAAAYVATDWAGVRAGTTSQVAFKNFDGRYFLSQVSVPGEDMRTVPLTKVSAEQTLTALNLMPAHFVTTRASK